MAFQSEGLDYFVLGILLDYLCSPRLWLKTDQQRFVLLLASWDFTLFAWNGSLGWVVLLGRFLLLQTITLECRVVRLCPRAFCSDPHHIYYNINTEPVWPSGKRLPQWKFVEWVCEFAGKFFYHNNVIGGCGCTYKLRNFHTIIFEVWSEKLEQFCKYHQEYNN